MGRWLSPDWSASAEPVPYAELSDPQTLNLYGYVRNNPLYKADADGHDWNDSLDFLGGVVKGVASSMTGGYIGAPSANVIRAACWHRDGSHNRNVDGFE
jgi:hypothetical protein